MILPTMPVVAIAVFTGKDTTATGPGLLTPTDGGLGSEILAKVDSSEDRQVQLLQVVNLVTGANVSQYFVLATDTKDAASMAIFTPQVFQVQGQNFSADTFIATFGTR